MKSITSLISTSLFRVFVIAMLSTCLICAPLWAMKSANATTRNMASADQNLQVAPPSTVS